MKRLFILLFICKAVSGYSQNVNVWVREVPNANYKIESTYEPLPADLMAAAARGRAQRFRKYCDEAYEALNRGDKYGFITYTNYALSTDYYNAKMYYDRGKVFQELGDYKQAKKNFRKAKKYGYYQAEQALGELKIWRKINR